MRHLAWILVLVSLAACRGGGVYVPVWGAGDTQREGARQYIVQRGDTLYSIAFQHGMDYKQLAALNNIHPPYTIYVDQRLRLGDPSRRATPSPGQASAGPAPPISAISLGAQPTPVIDTPKVSDASINWQWPYDGVVVNNFSLTGKINKGIDIRGKPGAPVRSTAAGVVVYAGGGLRGYGKLVIVKHNDRYLSAYGHNQSILVKEGETVKAGQVVSRLGGVSGNEDLLHFEIRRDGKPQDPLQFLPQRDRSRG